MKILFSSDLHGNYEAYNQYSKNLINHDIGILAGDQIDDYISEEEKKILGLNINKNDIISGLEYKLELFYKVLTKTNKKIFYVKGNHDIIEWKENGNIINIEKQKINFGKYSIVGIKDSFIGMESKFKDVDYYNKMIDENSIIVMHCPPHGILDTIELPDTKTGVFTKKNNGNKKLKELIENKTPKFVLFGHIHENFGIYKNMINGSFPLANGFFSINLENGKVNMIKI